jgi:hypothetical protein
LGALLLDILSGLLGLLRRLVFCQRDFKEIHGSNFKQQEMADLGSSLNSPPTDNFTADDTLSYSLLAPHDLGKFFGGYVCLP